VHFVVQKELPYYYALRDLKVSQSVYNKIIKKTCKTSKEMLFYHLKTLKTSGIGDLP